MIDPDSPTSLIILLILVALHAFFVAAYQSITSLGKSSRLDLIEKTPSARVIDRLAEDPILLLTAVHLALKPLALLIVTFTLYVYTDPLIQILTIGRFVVMAGLALTTAVVILLFGELIPRELGRQFAPIIAVWSIYPFKWLAYPAAPVAHLVAEAGQLLSGGWDPAERKNGSHTITEQDLRSYMDVGEEEGVLKEEAKEMIYSIFDLDVTLAREIMVPRIDMVAIEADSSFEAAMETLMEAGHSRVPVYAESIDNIIGILYVKDLLSYWCKGESPALVRGLEREVYYVPETKPVSDLLRELQAKKVHIAIVVDEYGGTAGLVTIEDVLEEIVGEIQDEHDADEFFMEYISDDEYIFSARMDLDDINNIMSLHLPTDESDTLGGLVYNVLGRIPKAGDTLNGASFGAPDLYLTVLAVDGRRIKTVKIKRLPEKNNQIKDQKSTYKPASPTLINNVPKTASESSFK